MVLIIKAEFTIIKIKTGQFEVVQMSDGGDKPDPLDLVVKRLSFIHCAFISDKEKSEHTLT